MTAEVRLSALAVFDIESAADFYTSVGGEALALRFVAAVEASIDRMARGPRTGSAWFAAAFDIDGLRATKLARFPYVIFYVPHSDRIDVWRVLHERRDLRTAVGEPTDL